MPGTGSEASLSFDACNIHLSFDIVNSFLQKFLCNFLGNIYCSFLRSTNIGTKVSSSTAAAARYIPGVGTVFTFPSST